MRTTFSNFVCSNALGSSAYFHSAIVVFLSFECGKLPITTLKSCVLDVFINDEHLAAGAAFINCTLKFDLVKHLTPICVLLPKYTSLWQILGILCCPFIRSAAAASGSGIKF